MVEKVTTSRNFLLGLDNDSANQRLLTDVVRTKLVFSQSTMDALGLWSVGEVEEFLDLGDIDYHDDVTRDASTGLLYVAKPGETSSC